MEQNIQLTLSYGLSTQFLKQKSEIAHVAPSPKGVQILTDTVKNSLSKILLPFSSIYGISRTVKEDNPLCAASVRANAKLFFSINLPPSPNAEGLRKYLRTAISDGREKGKIISPSLVGDIVEYTSFLIFSKSIKRPKDGHVAKGFRRVDGSIYVIDTELRMDAGKKTGEPIEYHEYLDTLQKMRRPVVEIIAIPSDVISL